MATTGILNATAVKFKAATTGGTVANVDLIKDSTITINSAERDITTKDSQGWTEMIPGIKDASIDLTCLLKLDATFGYTELQNAQLAGTALDLEIQVGVAATGDYLMECVAHITSLSLPSAYEDNIEFSVSLKVTGALTYTLVS